MRKCSKCSNGAELRLNLMPLTPDPFDFFRLGSLSECFKLRSVTHLSKEGVLRRLTLKTKLLRPSTVQGLVAVILLTGCARHNVPVARQLPDPAPDEPWSYSCLTGEAFYQRTGIIDEARRLGKRITTGQITEEFGPPDLISLLPGTSWAYFFERADCKLAIAVFSFDADGQLQIIGYTVPAGVNWTDWKKAHRRY